MTRHQHCTIRNDNRLVKAGAYLPPSLDLDISDKRVSRSLMIHSEAAAINNATFDLTGATLYTEPRFPCSDCALRIIQAGITKVVAPTPTEGSYWYNDQRLAMRIFERAGIDVEFARGSSA